MGSGFGGEGFGFWDWVWDKVLRLGLQLDSGIGFRPPVRAGIRFGVWIDFVLRFGF